MKAQEQVAAALDKLDRAREKADDGSEVEFYFTDGSSSDE